jgi:hypothetical protein
MARIAAMVERVQAPPDPWGHVPDPREDPAFEFDPVMSPPRPLHVADILERPANADEWGAERFYRPGSIVTIGATPGVGKSWIRAEIAIRQVTGQGDILGTYAVRRQANVLVIDEDMGPLEEWLREEAVATALGVSRYQLTGYYRLSFAGVRLEDENWCGWLERTIHELDIGLLILDPISEMYAVKELREELKPIKDRLRGIIRRKPGLVVMLVHHLKKIAPGSSAADRTLDDLRGGLWAQASDVVALISPLGDRRVKWQVLKRVPPSTLILEQTDAGPFVCIGDADSRDEKAGNDDRVMACIDAGSTAVDEVVEATGLPKRTVWNAVQRLRQAQILESRGALKRRRDAA